MEEMARETQQSRARQRCGGNQNQPPRATEQRRRKRTVPQRARHTV
jgi:hypothetical protein